MQSSDLENLLNNAQVLETLPDSKAQEQMEELLAHPGLPLLWGLMLGAKQTQHVRLQHSPLGNMEQVSRASVIQGTIFGIDLLYTTLLEQTVPPSEQEQK